jgi:NarL family two-component system response regulator LiaR
MTMPIWLERAMDTYGGPGHTRRMGEKISVVLADDHVLVRRILKLELESDGVVVVGEAADGRKAVELVRSLRPDVVVLDHRMPELSGLGAARTLLEERADERIIILTSDDDPRVVAEAARIGARAHVFKDATAGRLLRMIHLVASGGTGPGMRPVLYPSSE